jgi:hypothetical protein
MTYSSVPTFIDATTLEFLRRQKSREPPYRRSYLSDIYGIIEGVERGLGRAVVPRHLIEGSSRAVVQERYRSLRLDVHLGYFEQPVQPRLLSSAIEAIRRNFRLSATRARA